jgi:hypothetical protein
MKKSIFKSFGSKLGLLALCFMLVVPITAAAATPIEWSVDPDSAPDLRSQLGGLFGEYALLNSAFAMAVIDENNENTRNEFKAYTSVQANIDDVYTKLEQVVGVEQAVLFQLQLENHFDSYFNYVLAVKSDDPTEQNTYRGFLTNQQNELFQLIQDWNLNIQTTVLQDSLDNATDELLFAADYYDLGYYAESYSAIRQSHREMGRVGELLADGLAQKYSETYEGQFYSAQSDFHLRMARDFGAHSFFASVAVKNKLNGHDDRFNQAQQVLKENTNDIGASISNVYGYIEGINFEVIWQRHIDDVLGYADTLADDSSAVDSNAVENYMEDHQDLIDFLTGLNPGIDADLLISIRDGHGYDVLLTAAHFSTGDYENGFKTMRESYAEAFDLGHALGKDITTQFPDKFKIDTQVSDVNKVVIHLNENMLTTKEGTYILESEPRIINGTTFLPVNTLGITLDADIDWNTETSTVAMITTDDEKVTIYDEHLVTFAGSPYVLDEKIIVEQETAWIPLRAVAETIGWDVSYDADKHEIVMTY